MKVALTFGILIVLTACASEPPANEIRASGHVEATEVRLAPETGGRIVELAVKEGDTVEQGALILRLDPRTPTLAVERAKAEQRHAEAQLRLLQAGARPEDIAQAQAQAQAARDDLAAARAELASAEADFERFEALLEANAGSRKQRDDAATRRDVARERVQAAESRVRAADQVTARLRAGARAEEIEAARARIAAAAAAVATAEEALNDTTLRAPIAGVVTETLVSLGEVIAPRAPAAVLADLAHAWADVFVAEPAIPRLRLNQPATIFTDAGGAGISGTVSYISPKAEFTPRNVQTAEERSKLVYRVRVSVQNDDGVLKQGMPVEAVLPLQPVP
ncbi:MAG TPA: HlyD family efflux transporter periplasmic adaptor subunit [Vicinamibacterales bacterium]|nr:HlyD family efflux transporter periplasmic adaptor subunit [Vicinamibacterales bacterium]